MLRWETGLAAIRLLRWERLLRMLLRSIRPGRRCVLRLWYVRRRCVLGGHRAVIVMRRVRAVLRSFTVLWNGAMQRS